MKTALFHSGRGLRFSSLLSGSFMSLALVLAACSTDENDTPTTKPPVIGDDAGSDSTGTGGGTDTDTDTDAPDNTDTEDPGTDTEDPGTDTETEGPGVDDDGGLTEETEGPDGGLPEGTDTDTDVPDGTDPENTEATEDTEEPVVPIGCVENDEPCISCPEEPEEFLNQCSNASCSPFDNVARVGRYVPGGQWPPP